MKTNSFMERGQALILITLAAIGLVGITGLAIDGSAKFSDRRHAQNAADAAALAGALAKANAESAGDNAATVWAKLSTAALNRADDNGYDGNLVSNVVEVHSPPVSGPYVGKDLYVQVIITSYVDTFFSKVLGIAQTQNIVQATALAGKGGSIAHGASVVAMNPNPNCSTGGGSGGGSFDVGGNGEIHLSGGGMFVNSSASCGYSQTSCSVILTMGSGVGISSAGSAINQACGTPVPQSTTAEQILIPDEIVYPDKPAECGTAAPTPTNNPSGSDSWTIYPGYYTDFPQAGLIGNNKEITMSPGVYCVDGDVHWSGATFDLLDGTSGVTIYITKGHDFSLSINSPILMDASNSGDYAGYLIILEGDHNTHPNCTINGGSYLEINGTIFAPYCNITINGDNSTDSEFNAQIIGWDVKLNGGNLINIHYNPDDNGKIKRRIGLMR
ncbi:MAG TPA: pilus assembly protein TadG-related protein [Anaerolineales bacterium]|nr:pilus assembly protein TadG-related protein [Anaerolineales bacterium]